MTEKDKELINEAENTIWEAIGRLIEQAESEEAKEIMKNIQAHKYYGEKFKHDRW